MQKSKITILTTAALDTGLAEQIVAEGMAVETVPFISIEPVSTTVLKSDVEPLLKKPAVIVFTSSNAVETVAACVNGEKPDWKIYCIGNNTRRAVEKYFGAAVVADVAENALWLADKIISRKINEPVIFFCGNQRRDELPDKLQAAGIKVQEMVVYETRPTPKKLDDNFDAILFYSPSGVVSFFSVNQVQPATVLFAIGSTTEAALTMYTNNKIIKGDKQEKADLVKKVIEYFNK
jgi:uroporphyrinogen-III synthase